MGSTRPRLLIVDDEAPQMQVLRSILELEGYDTTGFVSASEALEALAGQEFDLILTDLMMPEMDGISFLRSAFASDPNVVGIVMSGQGAHDTVAEALKAGALDYILKPFQLSALLPALVRALTIRKLRMENIQLREAMSMYDVGSTLSLPLDTNAVAQTLADTVLRQTQARSVSVLLLDVDKNELRSVAACGEESEGVKDLVIPLDPLLAGWVSDCCKLLINNDEGVDLRGGFVIPLSGLVGISVPMLVARRLIGIVNLHPRSSRQPITRDQARAMNMLIGATTAALEASSQFARLTTAEQRYRGLADTAPDVVFRYDLWPRPCFAYVNSAIKTLTGHPPEAFYADPHLGLEIVHPEDRHLMEEVLSGASPSGGTVTLRWVSKDGTVAWIEHHSAHVLDALGTLVAVEGIARDITERKNREEELRHAQRMEVIGRLTGGVAHDFNNLLTVINGYTAAMLDEVRDNAHLRDSLGEVRKACDRAGVLTRQLVAFGRKQFGVVRTLNLNSIVSDSENMLGRVLGDNIEFVTVLDPALSNVKAYEGQVEQVLLNLAINARDAMPRGGRFTITTSDSQLVDGSRHQAGPAAKEGVVVLVVNDTGCGMDAATLSMVFEPFFTTKGPGRGTGLGLSIVQEVIHQNGGRIAVRSEPGKGTTFTISLKSTHEQVAVSEAYRVMPDLPRGTETIMVVEDDAAVRHLMCGTLRHAGYHVVSARNPRAALRLTQDIAGKYALVVVDLGMRQMSGPALVDELTRQIPWLKVIYTSGRAVDSGEEIAHLDPAMPLIQKPFTAHTLLLAVRTALDFGSQ
ncbi:response regulator [Paludibaculum fermentans]|uniref:response regulator n=1 Tax=Paludibaculum fermentans TaxID=1473598 RepID=UPI003EC0DDBF